MFASLETLNVVMALKEGRNRLIIVGAIIAPIIGGIIGVANFETFEWLLNGMVLGLIWYVLGVIVIWVIYRMAKWVYQGFKE